MKSVHHLLTSEMASPLTKLLHHSQLLSELEVQLCKQLPPPLNQHCRVAHVQQGCLVIHTDAAVWATQLRFTLPVILRQWQPDFMSLREVKVKVKQANDSASQQHELNIERHLSSKTTTLLTQVAQELSHSALETALLRLAQHGELSR